MKFNDLDLDNWKELDINVNSLWIIPQRDNTGKHSNIYHGNFIPQIPNQLIRRYTKKEETVLDIFLGSGTTLYECEKLKRNFIGFDINKELLNYVKINMKDFMLNPIKWYIDYCDVTNKEQFNKKILEAFKNIKDKKISFTIMHPPYFDIIKFTDEKEDLSNLKSIDLFMRKFHIAVENGISFLERDRYFAVVIGDIYKKGEVIPLGFEVMNLIKNNFDVKLKGIIIKNIEGNRGKLGKGGIWRYRALKSDYYIFKHEYIFVFKKEF